MSTLLNKIIETSENQLLNAIQQTPSIISDVIN